MKTMGTSKCVTFNEFISDARTQENNNSIYAASKSRKRAFEVGASQSRATVAPRVPSRPPTMGAKFCPMQKKAPAKTGFRKAYTVSLPKGNSSQGSSSVPPSNMPCWNCNKPDHWARKCPYPKKKANQGGRQGQIHYTSIEEIPSGEVVTTGEFLIDQHSAVVLFDSGASHSFISPLFASKFPHKLHTIESTGYCIRAASGNIPTNQVVSDVEFEIDGRKYLITLVVSPRLGIDVILGMNWMS
jgi:predicted aspartyl protease